MASEKRISKGKKINPTIFVFCEGKTEESYINFLKTSYRLPSVSLHPKITGNEINDKFIQFYKKDKSTHEKDLTFLVYDSDLPEVVEKLKQLKEGKAIFSNPCIELWFLLHFKNQTAYLSSKDCCKQLENRCSTDYKKGIINTKLKEKLCDKRKEAVARAKALASTQNPSSDLYQLIELLETIKK